MPPPVLGHDPVHFPICSTLSVGISAARTTEVSGVMAEAALLPLDVAELLDAGLVTAAFEGRGEEDVDDAQGEGVSEDAGPEGQHVGVVVLAGQPGGELIETEARSHTMDLVGGDGLTLAAAADDDPPVGSTGAHLPTHGGAQAGIVDRFPRVRAEVVQIVVTVAQRRGHHALEPVPGVVSGDGDPHQLVTVRTLSSLQRANTSA